MYNRQVSRLMIRFKSTHAYTARPAAATSEEQGHSSQLKARTTGSFSRLRTGTFTQNTPPTAANGRAVVSREDDGASIFEDSSPVVLFISLYFSLRTNQPPTTNQKYFSLTTNQHQLWIRLRTFVRRIDDISSIPCGAGKFRTSARESGCKNRFIRTKFPLLYPLLLQLSNHILLFTGFHQEQVEVVLTTRDLLDDAHAARERNTAALANLRKGAALVKMRKGNAADSQRQHFVRARQMRPSQRSR
jgi:hypothetical protein